MPSCCENLGVQADVPTTAHRDQFDDLAMADITGRNLRSHLPQVQAGNVVCYLENIVHVVRDKDDAETTVCEASNEIENLLGLGNTKCCGRLIEDDKL